MALIFDKFDASRPDVMLEPQGNARARVLLTRAPSALSEKGCNEALRGVDDWRLNDLDFPIADGGNGQKSAKSRRCLCLNPKLHSLMWAYPKNGSRAPYARSNAAHA